MNESEQNLQSADAVRMAAKETVAAGTDIRSKVRDLTLKALRERQLNAAEAKGVARAVTEGISLGLEKRTGDLKQAAGDALKGLDEALTKAAEATHLALRQLTSQGKDFTDNELRWALEDLKRMEEDFLTTVGGVAESAGSRIKEEMRDFVTHARRAGTDTGSKVAETVSEFGGRVKAGLGDGAAQGKTTAREVGSRLAKAASGLLAGLAEVLHEKSEKLKR